MDPEQQDEAVALEESARTMVIAEPRGLSLMLIRLPSFADSESVSIARGRRTDALRVSHVRWDRSVDMAKLVSPVERLRWPRKLDPTIVVDEQGLEPGVEAVIVRELNGIRIPARHEAASIGIDGTGYEVRWTNGSSGASFHWWESGPSEWQELGDWFDRSWSRLSGAITDR